MKYLVGFIAIIFLFSGCANSQPSSPSRETVVKKDEKKIDNPGTVVHVLVALCDNENQGIVPVPAALGNGEDPQKNLYWGAMYGVKTYFGKSASWTKLWNFANPKENVLERIVFKHKTANVYLVADAYRGIKIKETIEDFFSAVSGEYRENVKVDDLTLQILGGANLVAFVGHDGLMDFQLEKEIVKKDEEKRDAIVLACASRQYFGEHLKKTNAFPLLWTSNLMAPESYILHDALEGWTKNENPDQIQTRAAAAYSKFQKISLKSAQKLLVTGW